jgi:glucose/arabinose dehydrogenase
VTVAGRVRLGIRYLHHRIHLMSLHFRLNGRVKAKFALLLFAGICVVGMLACGQAPAQSPSGDLPSLQQAPQSYSYDIADLPAPYASPSASNGPHMVPRPPDGALSTPPGYRVTLWASGLNNPRFLTAAPNGDVFVAESGPGRIRLLRQGGGGAPQISTFVEVSANRTA